MLSGRIIQLDTASHRYFYGRFGASVSDRGTGSGRRYSGRAREETQAQVGRRGCGAFSVFINIDRITYERLFEFFQMEVEETEEQRKERKRLKKEKKAAEAAAATAGESSPEKEKKEKKEKKKKKKEATEDEDD